MWWTECPRRGDGRSGHEKSGSGGGVLEVVGIDVSCMPPSWWQFRIGVGSVEMRLSGVNGG